MQLNVRGRHRPLRTRPGGGLVKLSATLATAVVVCGCGVPSAPRPSSPAPSTAASAPAAASTPPSSATEAEGQDDHGQIRTATPEPNGDPHRTGAAGVAQKVMVLFARPGVDAARWMKDLDPYLSAQAQQDYQGTAPANVPARKVTGRAAVVATDSTRLARVHVPTDAGVYLVVLSRSASDPTWRVERITPPEEVGD